MDRLDAMKVFVTVADMSGFARASRELGLSRAAVTRAVALLERRTGTRLFYRTTRHVRLTEAGIRYHADCKRILSELEDAEASAAGSHAEPRGPLTITAPVLFGRMHIAPILLEFLARYRGVTAQLLLIDRIVDMMEEGIDVAVRIARLPDSAFSAIRVGSVRRVVVASPEYLAVHGEPRTPDDLAGMEAIVFSQSGASAEWTFRSGVKTVGVLPPSQLAVNSGDVAIAAAIAGRGVTRVLSYQVADEVKAGRLRILLEDFEGEPLPVHLVHPDGRRAAARVRSFLDFAADRLRGSEALRD